MSFVGLLLLLYVPSCSTFLHHPSSLRTPASRIVQRCPFQMQLPPPRHRRSDYPVRPPALSLGALPKSSPGSIQGDDAGPASSGAKPGGDWVPFVFLAAVSVLICYADRSNLSDAIIPMTLQYGWSKTSEGAVLSSFFIGYALTQVLGGGLADRFGGGRVLTGAVFAWSAATVLTPYAASVGLPSLLAMRIAMGVGEGPAFPAIHSMISRVVPAESRSTAVAAVTASSYVGCVAALSLSPGIIEGRGWPSVFYIFGAAGFAWLPLWAIYTSRSSLARAIGQRQLPPPSSGSGGSEGGGFDIALIGKLAKERGVLAILAAQYTQSWGLYGILGWLPTLLSERYGVPVGDLAGFTVVPYAVQGAIGLASGIIADRMISGGTAPKDCRRTLQGIGMVGPAVMLLAAASAANTPEDAQVLLTLGLGMSALTLGGVSAAHLDLSQKHSGTIFGMGNTLGTFGGFVSTWACGAIQETYHSWGAVLSVIAAHYLIGAVLFSWLVDDEPLDY